MLKLRRHHSKKIGLPQGTLVHIGEKYTENVKLTVSKYSKDDFQKIGVKSVQECMQLLDESSSLWINVIGIHDSKIIQEIGTSFGISSLTLEEIMNTNTQPKIEQFQEYLFVVARSYFYGETSKTVNFENISIILGKNFVITFQEKENDVFNSINSRISESTSLLRNKKSDYLFCAIIDSIVDHYFPAIDYIAQKIESIEVSIASDPNEKLLHDIYQLRQEVVIFSKIMRPERQVLNSLLRDESDFIGAKTSPYIHDVYEHVIHIIETLDSYGENVTGLHELYLSTISNKMSEVMKTLTIIASLFIPITFVAGIYGMNFHYMPELSSQFGYPAVLMGMIVIVISFLFYFKKKKWL